VLLNNLCLNKQASKQASKQTNKEITQTYVHTCTHTHTQAKEKTDLNFVTSPPAGSGGVLRDRERGWVLNYRFIYHFFNCNVYAAPSREMTVNNEFKGTH
jgi:hypothetical protein